MDYRGHFRSGSLTFFCLQLKSPVLTFETSKVSLVSFIVGFEGTQNQVALQL